MEVCSVLMECRIVVLSVDAGKNLVLEKSSAYSVGLKLTLVIWGMTSATKVSHK